MDLTHSWLARIGGMTLGFAALFIYLTTDFERRWQPGRRKAAPAASPRSGAVRGPAQPSLG